MCRSLCCVCQAASGAESVGDAIVLLTRAVEAAKWCLSTGIVDPRTGWQHPHVRPYMRALMGLSRVLFQVTPGVGC